MQLYMKQKMLSFKQDFNIVDANQKPVYKVDGELISMGRKLHIIDLETNQEVALVKQKVLTLMPHVDVFVNDKHVAGIRKRLTFFKPQFEIDQIGWTIEGDYFAHDYNIYDREGDLIAQINKKFFAMSDTFEFNIDSDEVDPVMVIAVVLAIDTVMDSKD
ncbi:LURP-one-related family protein [Aerococcaceae bacterium DSM 111021]|nr:LURP-one-related family protein [Aerococcaceae bacterium DSM 111021]